MQINWYVISEPQEYSHVLKILEYLVDLRIQNRIPDSIFLLEHKPIFTAGRSFHHSEILDRNLQIVKTNRGGKITFHSPGQRIIYPIIKLDNKYFDKDLHKYVALMEQWIINSLQILHVKSYKLNRHVGIWTQYKGENAKIASLGFRVKKWTIYHGMSINICNDLQYFNKIIPCGIRGSRNISLQQLGIEIDLNRFDQILVSQFYNLFNIYNHNEIVFEKNFTCFLC